MNLVKLLANNWQPIANHRACRHGFGGVAPSRLQVGFCEAAGGH